MAKQLSVDCEKFNIQGAVFFCDAISVDVIENWLLS